jgi:hypothetical protein
MHTVPRNACTVSSEPTDIPSSACFAQRPHGRLMPKQNSCSLSSVCEESSCSIRSICEMSVGLLFSCYTRKRLPTHSHVFPHARPARGCVDTSQVERLEPTMTKPGRGGQFRYRTRPSAPTNGSSAEGHRYPECATDALGRANRGRRLSVLIAAAVTGFAAMILSNSATLARAVCA